MRRLFVLFASAILFYSPLFGQDFTSPRATALGGYIAVSDDIYGVDWNLAAVAFSRHKLDIAFASGSDIDGFEDLRILWRPGKGHVLYFRHTPGLNSFSLVHKSRRPLLPQVPLDLLTRFDYKDDLGLGYAVQLSRKLAAGIDFRRRTYQSAFLFDRFWSTNISFSFQPQDNLRFGLVAENLYNYQYKKSPERFTAILNDSVQTINLGSELFQSVNRTPQPRLNFGMAFRPWSKLLLAADLISDGGFGGGLEWRTFKFLLLRLGAHHRSDLLYKGDKATAVSAGFGIVYSIARFDFAYYRPVGRRENRVVRNAYGSFNIRQIKNDALLLSARFAIK